MIAGMAPVRRAGEYVFVSGDLAEHADGALMIFREDEGLTLVLEHARAAELALAYDGIYACITLTVHSALDGVGLTAAVSGALSAAGIPCNMVAAFHHDHVFVPAERVDDALAILNELATRAAAGCSPLE